MCGCDCCNSSNPACFDPSKVDSWASCKALSCGCDCGGCLSRVIDGAFDEGQRLGKQMGMDAAREAIAALLVELEANHDEDRHDGAWEALVAIDALREGEK